MSKHLLITGSTDGIGKLAATSLAAEGHAVYLHGRNAEKLQRTIEAVKAESGNANVSGYVADFSDLQSVRQLAAQLQKELPRLDVLINNAGIFKSPVERSDRPGSEGLDLRMVVNYLAPVVLTQHVLPLLEQAGGARIVNLSSAAQSPVSLLALAGKATMGTQEAYAQSKLALTMWSFALAQQVRASTVLAVNPGSLLNTKMVQEAYGQHWWSADKGAKLLHDLALAKRYEGITGQYFNNDLGHPRGDFGPAHADAYDAEKIDGLLTTTKRLLADFLP